MAKDEKCCEGVGYNKKKWHHHGGGMFGGIYGLAFIGAAIYYVQQATTFGGGVVGILKALVWPAMLIYKVFTLLKM